MVRVRISHRQEVVSLGQTNSIDLGGGGFQKGHAIFELIGLFQRKGLSGKTLDSGHGTGIQGTTRFKEAEQSCRARHEGWPDTHAVREVEEPALKPSVIGES